MFEQHTKGTGTGRRAPRGEDGFTFLELTVVVIIIGILAAIALPMYHNHTQSAANKLAASDVRNAVAVIESCAVENAYPSQVTSAGAITGCPGSSIKLSDNTSLAYTATGSPATGFVIAGVNSRGGQVYCYNSAGGGGSVVEVSGGLSGATC